MRTKHYNTSELAAVLGCSPGHIYQLLKEGRIKGYKHRKGKWLIPKDQDDVFASIRSELAEYREQAETEQEQKESFIKYIADSEHYEDIFARMCQVRKCLKIASANLKNFTVYLDDNAPIQFCDFLLILLRRGVRIQIVCMQPFSFYRWVQDNLPELLEERGLEIRQNDHVHMKVFIFDDECAYIGSANLTGAAIGKRSSRQRNYEAGVLAQNNDIFESASKHFNKVWKADETIESETYTFTDRL